MPSAFGDVVRDLDGVGSSADPGVPGLVTSESPERLAEVGDGGCQASPWERLQRENDVPGDFAMLEDGFELPPDPDRTVEGTEGAQAVSTTMYPESDVGGVALQVEAAVGPAVAQPGRSAGEIRILGKHGHEPVAVGGMPCMYGRLKRGLRHAISPSVPEYCTVVCSVWTEEEYNRQSPLRIKSRGSKKGGGSSVPPPSIVWTQRCSRRVGVSVVMQLYR